MIRSGTILALTAGFVAFSDLHPTAFAATNPTSLNQVETPAEPAIVERRFESAAPASPATGVRPPTGNPLWAIPLRSLSATQERPIFSPTRRPPPPPVIAAPLASVVKPPPPKPPELDHPPLTLMGTVVGESEGIGIFLDQVTSNVVRMRTGEGHAGWLLRSIVGREAIFENGRRSATLTLPVPAADQATRLPTGSSVIARSGGDAWMDGDGQLISPPPRKTP
jgi:general secretion pathway protein N